MTLTIRSLGSLLLLALLPLMAFGQTNLAAGDGTSGPLAGIITTSINFINQILIPAILALAFLVFIWGVFKYFVAGGADDDAKEKGKSLMLYAIAGFVLILIFFGAVNLFAGAIGLRGGEAGFTPPTGPVPSGTP